MTAKIIEVLAKILEGLGKNYSLEEVNRSLLKNKSFNKQIVSAAFSWMFDKKLNSLRIKRQKKISKKFRILLEEEKEILGVENYNYITYLMNIGLLNPSDLDSILEQIMLYPGDSITKEEINWIILFSLVDFEEDILPGSRYLLYSSDTIN